MAMKHLILAAALALSIVGETAADSTDDLVCVGAQTFCCSPGPSAPDLATEAYSLFDDAAGCGTWDDSTCDGNIVEPFGEYLADGSTCQCGLEALNSTDKTRWEYDCSAKECVKREYDTLMTTKATCDFLDDVFDEAVGFFESIGTFVLIALIVAVVLVVVGTALAIYCCCCKGHSAKVIVVQANAPAGADGKPQAP